MTSAQVGTGYILGCSRVRGRTLAGLGAVLLFAGLPAGATAAEPPDGGCPVVASAQGVQIVVSASDNILLSAPTGAGIPVAQACVDYAVRDSAAFASSPYPGETVISAPGLISNRTGQETPGYPAYVASRHPARERAEAEEPGYRLTARSTETASEAWARTAAGQDDAGSTLATARSTVDPGTKEATATATADTQPLTVNDVLRLGQIHSVASAEIDSEGTVRRSSDLRIGRTAVGGQEVVITPEGVRAAGQTVPAPDGGPAEALEAAGISVRYLAAEQTPRGVLSAGIEVVARQQDPESGAVTTVHYTLGRSYAAVSQVSADQADLGTDTPVDTGGVAVPPADDAPPDTGAVADGPAPGEPAPEPARVPAGSDRPPPSVAAADRLVANPVDMGMPGLYLVVVFGALAMFAAGTVLRLLGVKTRWTS